MAAYVRKEPHLRWKEPYVPCKEPCQNIFWCTQSHGRICRSEYIRVCQNLRIYSGIRRAMSVCQKLFWTYTEYILTYAQNVFRIYSHIQAYLINSHPRIYSDILTWLCVCQNIFRIYSDLRTIFAYSDISPILWPTCILTYCYIFWIYSDLRTICIQNIFAYSDMLLYILTYAYVLFTYILTYWHGYCQKSPVYSDTDTHGWVMCVTHIHMDESCVPHTYTWMSHVCHTHTHGWVMCVTHIYMDESCVSHTYTWMSHVCHTHISWYHLTWAYAQTHTDDCASVSMCVGVWVSVCVCVSVFVYVSVCGVSLRANTHRWLCGCVYVFGVWVSLFVSVSVSVSVSVFVSVSVPVSVSVSDVSLRTKHTDDCAAVSMCLGV